MRTVTFASIALLALSVASFSALAQEKPRTDQVATKTEVRDHGYLFLLRLPGPGWQLMAEKEAANLIGDAVAATRDMENNQDGGGLSIDQALAALKILP